MRILILTRPLCAYARTDPGYKAGQGDPSSIFSVRFDDTLTVQGAVAVLDCFAQAQLTSAPVLLVPDA